MSEQCRAQPMGGGCCELPAGHEGKHRLLLPSGRTFFEWTDESQRQHSSRFD